MGCEKSGAMSPPVFDAHLDLGMYLRQERQKGRRKVIAEDFITDMKENGVIGIISAIFVDEGAINGSALEQACEQIAALRAEERESPGLFRICTDYQTLRQAIDEGVLAILLSFEGAEPLGMNPELLNFFHDAGVRGLGLAHARRNQACDGARYSDSPYNGGCGLTDFGAELVRRAEELGMLIDISHLNDPGTADVLAITSAPVIASHSNCRALNPTRRNLTDEQIRAVADRGGVVGVNGCSAIVSDRSERAGLEMLANHVDHLVRVGGIDHVGLGLDIAEMILPDSDIEVNGRRQRIRDLVPGYAGLPLLTDTLRRRGYTEEELTKIYSGNFLRVFQEVL